jgi:hypothetical protein
LNISHMHQLSPEYQFPSLNALLHLQSRNRHCAKSTYLAP